MRHEGSWADLRSLDQGWWCINPPTAIIETSGGPGQLTVISYLFAFGYRPKASYVFGAELGADRFHTGSYTPGPIESFRRLARRQRSPIYLIGVRVADEHWPALERLARTVPKVSRIADTLERYHAAAFVPEVAQDVFGPLPEMASLATRIDYSRRGILWPPIREGDNWRIAGEPPAQQVDHR